METPEHCRHKNHQDNVIDVCLVFLLLTLNTDFAQYSDAPTVDFKEVNAGWEWWFNEK